MITVGIFINERLIAKSQAVNTTDMDDQGRTIYRTNKDKLLYHRREDGALPLVQQLVGELVPEDFAAPDHLSQIEIERLMRGLAK